VAKAPKKRGRPAGSISLTAEREVQALAYYRVGCPDEEVAELLEISARTLLEWIARGEGRSEKTSSPKLRRFAKAVAKAKAEAKASARVSIKEKRPDKFLDLLTAQAAAAAPPTYSPEQIRTLAVQLVEALLRQSTVRIAPCPDADCHCPFHAKEEK